MPAEAQASVDAPETDTPPGSGDETETAPAAPDQGEAEQTADQTAPPTADSDADPDAPEAARNDGTDAQAASAPTDPAASDIPAQSDPADPPEAAQTDQTPAGASASREPAQDISDPEPATTGGRDSGTVIQAGAGSAAAGSTATAESAPASSAPSAAAPVPPPPAAKGGFFPMLLGGLVAGGIGYGVHSYLSADQNGADAQIAALQSELAELRMSLSGLPEASDLARVEAELTDLRSDLASAVERVEGLDVAGEVDAGMDRLRAEFASSEDVSPDTQLVAQIGNLARDLQDRTARLDAVDAGLNTQGAELAALADELAQIRELAEHRIEEAEAAVDTALAGAGLETMRTALARGAAYPEALALLREAGIAVPEALAGPAAQGVPTLEMLQESFAPAARAGLRAALQQAPADSTTERLGNFLRAQVGARSTAPREGDDPDAVMSRAAAALEAGDIDATLAELDALPDAAMPAMQDWMAAARARLDAEAAIVDFATIVTNQ